MRRADVGQPPDRGIGREPRSLTHLQAPDLAREIGDDARDLDVDIAENGMPPAEPRGEIGDVVRGDGAIAQLAVDAHLAQEILVAGPRIADERNVGDVDVRTGRDDGGILEAQRTVGQVETPREMVEHEAAALTCRHGLDGGVDRLPVDGEVADTRRDAVEVHVAEVDAEFGVAPREPLQAEIHAFDGSLAQRQAEIALPGLVGVADAVDDLLDVHLPLGGLAQVELRPADLAAAEYYPAAEDAQPRDVGVEAADVEQRVALVILDVEALDLDLAEKPDVHAVDAHGGFELPGYHAHGFLYHVVLHGGNIEQQRKHHGQNYQQQNRYREHLSQYFYTFAH